MSATIYAEVDPPVYGVAWHFFISLISQANTNVMQSTATLAAGDVKVSIDGGALNNLTTLPVVTPAASKLIRVDLSAAEMTGNQIMVLFSDAEDAEWQDAMVMISTMQLGTLSQTAAAVTAAVSGTSLAMTIGVTYAATISSLTISATWTKVYMSVKRDISDSDDQSILQIMVTNPADAVNDGIMYINGNTATALQKAMGTLTVNQAGGTVAIAITDNGMLCIPSGSYTWDLKSIISGTSSTVLSASAACVVGYTDTHAV